MTRIFPLDDAPPLTPDRDEAYDWLVSELSRPEYAAAQPTLIDRIATAIRDWFLSLVIPSEGTFAAWIPVIVVLLVIAAIVASLLIWGVPRRNRARRRAMGLFGEDDTRSADELRDEARKAAQQGSWDAAVLEAFRALARGLDERTIVTVLPGTTARACAEMAAQAFPAHTAALDASATAFDTVRYLDGHATAEQYQQIADLDAAVASTAPARLPAEAATS